MKSTISHTSKYVIPSFHKWIVAAFLFTFFTSGLGAEQTYYKQEALFYNRPDSGKSSQTIDRFGPVGMAIDLIQPAFTMRIHSIEAGSPAAATGKLKKGQIIESINGETLKDIDPRIQLGNIITRAEATDGLLKMKIAEKPGATSEEVVVKLPVLGAYSKTWPLDCPKSDKIVRNFAEQLKTKVKGEKGNLGYGFGMLFLLSTGDEGDLEFVREWVQANPAKISVPFHTWNSGLFHLALPEYYLRTGDEQVLPVIQAMVDQALEAEWNGGWGNRNACSGLYYGGGGGHLNAGGVHLATFLMLAKECGANMPDESFHRVLRHFYRWAGRGNIPYGNGKPEAGYSDNGKNGGFAFTMAAAVSLTPKGEDSIYARARDVSALFSFYSTSYMLHGHTGGGIGEIWRSAAMALLKDSHPAHYRNFMDERRWHYELSRRHDGSFCILGGERYDKESWGNGYALTYTVPRKTLRLTGAPRSKYSKPYQLPERLWGTGEDEDFVSVEPIAYPDGTKPDFSKETLRDSGGKQLLAKRRGGLSDEELKRYIRHPNHEVRTYCVVNIVKRELPFVMELLRSDDARLRRLGLLAVAQDKEKFLQPEVFELVSDMVENPEESWFVKEQALKVLGLGSADQIVAKIDLILPYLEHEEWWLQHSTLAALTKVIADKRVYRKTLPALARLLETNHSINVLAPLRWGKIPESLRNAEPEVAALAKKELKEAYTAYVELDHPLPVVTSHVNPVHREEIARAIMHLPGGYDTLYQVAKQRSPGAGLPYEKLFLEADPAKFSPELREVVNEIIKTRLIPRQIAKKRDFLLQELDNQTTRYGSPRIFGIVDLYERIGIHDYDWKDFGPEMTGMKWDYHSFDPPEKKGWDTPPWRYREITLPSGMEDWFKASFDPDQHGWKEGLQPFGSTNGELVGTNIFQSRHNKKPGTCPHDFCRHRLPMQTLWDKEVLLLRGSFEIPEFKEDHRYRLVVGGMSHVGAGEGLDLYLNGKLFYHRKEGVGKRGGAQPVAKFIDKTWWPEFENGKVDIAVKSFMGVRRGVRTRHMSIWFQEMKLPEISEEEIVMSATVYPMTCTEWQSLQDPDDNDKDPEAGKFLWDGKYIENPEIIGSWKTIAVAKSPDEYDPAARQHLRNLRIKEKTFKAGGQTDELLWIYSGDMLMNLVGNEALRMQHKTIDGKEYLFIEQGGYSTRQGHTWRPAWEVMTPSKP